MLSLQGLVQFVRGRTPYKANGWQSVLRSPFTWFTRPGVYDYKPLLDNGLWTNSTVACGVDWLARNWQIPVLQVVRVDEDGIETPVRHHPALALLRRPHPYLNGQALSSAFIRDITCIGSSWVEKVYNRLGDVVELKPWPALNVTAVFPVDGSEYLEAWKVSINGHWLDVPPQRVIFSRKHIDPVQDRLGWTPLRSAVREIATLDEASTYSASLLQNFCVPGMIASPKGDYTISDDDAKVVKDKLKDSSTGVNRGDPVVLSGSYELVKAGFSPEEVGLHQMTRPAQDIVLAAMGLNADVLGLAGEKGPYGTYGDAIRAAWVHGLIPLQTLFAEEMSQQLLIDFEDPAEVRTGKIKFSWDYSPVEELDDREQIAANRALRLYQGNVLTLNESRDIVGYAPVSAPDADLLGIDRDKARVKEGLTPVVGGVVSEGDNLGSVKKPPQKGGSGKVPADTAERSKLEGERNSDALSPSRSGVNKHEIPDDDDDDDYFGVFKSALSREELLLQELEELEQELGGKAEEVISG